MPSTGDGPAGRATRVVGDRPSLVWAANLAAIEFHVPLWHAGRRRVLPAPPDHLVFDLDPGEGTSIVECCGWPGSWPRSWRRAVAAAGPRPAAPRASSSTCPSTGRPTWEKVRDRAHGIAVQLEQDHPDLVVSNMRKSLRAGKVLIDWSQNHPAKTTVAAYSLRARPEPTVSTPVTWDEVDGCADHGRPGRPPLHRPTTCSTGSRRHGRPLRRGLSRPGRAPCRTKPPPRMLGSPGQSPVRTTSAEEAAMSAMGERFLLLEETADALDVIDPELAVAVPPGQWTSEATPRGDTRSAGSFRAGSGRGSCGSSRDSYGCG